MQSEGVGMSLSAMMQLIMWAACSRNWLHGRGRFFQWANKMVTRWASAVIVDRCVVVTVIFNECSSVVDGDYVVGIVFEGRRGRLDYLWIPNDDGFVYVHQGLGS